uniref:Uncharacterized protein n=1 Tax=Salix viminalis TaxID=40686 RepID=A0A6N2LE20_SALVM
MGENENHVQSTRSSSSSRKRDPKAHHPLPPSKKKRVPLRELTNSLHVTTNNSDYNMTQQENQKRDPHVHPQELIWNPPENEIKSQNCIQYLEIKKYRKTKLTLFIYSN